MKTLAFFCKVLPILFLPLFFSGSAQAQVDKGRWLVNGEFDFDYTVADHYDEYMIRTYPKFGHFLADRFVLGVGLPMAYSNYIGFDDMFYSIGASVFTRYYTGGNKLRGLFHAEVQYHNAKNTISYPEGLLGIDGEPIEGGTFGYKNDGFGFGLGGGLAYFLSDRVALEGLLLFRRNDKLMRAAMDTRDFTAQIGFTVGFSIFLGRTEG